MADESEERKLPYGSDQLGYYVGQDDQYDPEDIEEPVVVEYSVPDVAICTGCAAHMPCVGGFHMNSAGDAVMTCQADKYALKAKGPNFTEDLRKRYAGKSAERDRDQADRAIKSCLEAYPANALTDVEQNDLARAKSIIKKLVHPDGEKNFVGLWADENKENERLRKEITILREGAKRLALIESWSDEEVAEMFHRNYERFAPSYAYKTRDASARTWKNVPESNRNLMISTAAAVLKEMVSTRFFPRCGCGNTFRFAEERAAGFCAVCVSKNSTVAGSA